MTYLMQCGSIENSHIMCSEFRSLLNKDKIKFNFSVEQIAIKIDENLFIFIGREEPNISGMVYKEVPISILEYYEDYQQFIKLLKSLF